MERLAGMIFELPSWGLSIIRNNPFPPVTGSGTGGVTVTTINGVPISKCTCCNTGTSLVAGAQFKIKEALGVTTAVNELNGDGCGQRR
jgi:hypothetical protein